MAGRPKTVSIIKASSTQIESHAKESQLFTTGSLGTELQDTRNAIASKNKNCFIIEIC